MDTYAEMAVLTSTTQAQIQGAMDKMSENGRDLVIVCDHPRECERCRPYENKVFSISGTNPDYPAIQEAIAGGLFHPRCKHALAPYIPGVTRPLKVIEDPEGYQRQQKQRELERNVRRWQKRMIVAITDEEKLKARSKFKLWTATNFLMARHQEVCHTRTYTVADVRNGTKSSILTRPQ